MRESKHSHIILYIITLPLEEQASHVLLHNFYFDYESAELSIVISFYKYHIEETYETVKGSIICKLFFKGGTCYFEGTIFYMKMFFEMCRTQQSTLYILSVWLLNRFYYFPDCAFINAHKMYIPVFCKDGCCSMQGVPIARWCWLISVS